MYLVSKESIGNCRSNSDFIENLMKIHKKIRKSKFQNSEKNKVWELSGGSGGGVTGVITPLVAEICLCSNSNFSPTGAIPPPP